jgi:hypothetical protein
MSCLKPVDFTGDITDPNGSLSPAADNPDLGTMSRATAEKIFELESEGPGLKITKLKSVPQLLAYLLQSSTASTSILNAGGGTLKISTIGNLPVVSIAEGAFAPSGANDDISAVIKFLELPATIQILGRDLFGTTADVSKRIFLDIPMTATVFKQIDVTSMKNLAGQAAGQNAIARIYNPSDQTYTVVLPAGTLEFQRPAPGFSIEYTIDFYDNDAGLARLTTAGGTTEYEVKDAALKKLFNAIYSPNAPDTTDAIETGKSAVPYNDTISQAVLSLFTITVGANAADDRVEIRGTSLPGAAAASVMKPIVIDIGIPGEDNGGLAFSIPYRGLGLKANNYAHIRFRVNKGAYLAIQADNTRYMENGAGNPCEPGYFKGGCVEVMAGGKLRDAAWEGFPLGTNAVILCRNGSYLAVGPEKWNGKAMLDYPDNDFARFYAGWLIGPANDNGGSSYIPRIVWDGGQGAEKYIEVRQGQIAIDAKVTARRSFGLIYSVWFVNDAALTIDTISTEPDLFGTGQHGVFANGNYNFYGSSGTLITIYPGNVLDHNFLNTSVNVPIGPSGQTSMIIYGTNGGTPEPYVDSSTGISGIHIPYPSP